MQVMIWLLSEGFVLKTGLVVVLLMELLILGDVGSLIWLLMSEGVFFLPVLLGTLRVLELHRFFIAIARAAVNEDGCAGVALHPTVWSSGGLVKRRKVRVSAWEYAWVQGPVGLWRHGFLSWPCIEVCEGDVGFCPCSVGLLVKLCSFFEFSSLAPYC